MRVKIKDEGEAAKSEFFAQVTDNKNNKDKKQNQLISISNLYFNKTILLVCLLFSFSA